MGNLFEELKRRNVIRVGVAYLVVGWLMIEVVDTIAPRMAMPEWVPGLVIILVLVGLPITLFLAWAFEMTPEGVKKAEDVDPEQSVTASTGQKLNYFIIGGLVLALGYFVWEQQAGGPAIDPEVAEDNVRENSIAVLPFADLSQSGDQEYFADGISEEILNVLARIPGLKVAGRTSSFKFKGQNEDLRIIGEQLDVAHVLEGSVRKSGNRLRITVQLIAADDGFHIWSESYDRELTDIFAIQDQISLAVAEALRIELGESTGTLIGAGTTSPEAYALYLRGREYFHKRFEANLIAARDLLEAALVLDTEFADAHAMLSRVLSMWPKYATRQFDTDAVMGRALAEADAAIAIDPRNATAWSSKGSIIQDYLGDQIESENALLRSVELEPGNSEIANFMGDYFRATMDLEKAIKWERRAVELDPLHGVNHRDLGYGYMVAGRFDEAVAAFRRSMELEDPFEATFLLGETLISAGRLDEARDLIDGLPGDSRRYKWARHRMKGYLATTTGDGEMFRDAVDGLEVMASDYLGANLIASWLYASAGDGANAALRLRRSLDSGNLAAYYAPGLITLPEHWPNHPDLDAIFAEPRYQRLFEIRRRNLGLVGE